MQGASTEQVRLVYNLYQAADLDLEMAIQNDFCRRDAAAFLAQHFPLWYEGRLVLVLGMVDSSPDDVLLAHRVLQNNQRLCTGTSMGSAIHAQFPAKILNLMLEEAIRRSKDGSTLNLYKFPRVFPDGYLSSGEGAIAPLKILEEMIVTDEEIQNVHLTFDLDDGQAFPQPHFKRHLNSCGSSPKACNDEKLPW
jgi:hypothetical protein